MNTVDIITAVEIGAMTMIDLRDLDEVRSSGHASGALHIPLSELAQKADPNSPSFDRRIARDRPIAVYSAGGARSAKAGELLTKLGYQVIDIGGFYHWAVAGGPVTR